MSDFIKKLASENNKVLYKTAVANFSVSYVDKDFRVVAQVQDKAGRSAEFDIDKLGAMYADETNKFYSLDGGELISKGEMHDIVIEAFLLAVADMPLKTKAPPVSEEHLMHEFSETDAEEAEEHLKDESEAATDRIVWDLQRKDFIHPHEASKKEDEDEAADAEELHQEDEASAKDKLMHKLNPKASVKEAGHARCSACGEEYECSEHEGLCPSCKAKDV